MATSTRERREEYSSNIVRTLSPTRPLSPGSNMSDIDNKLDYLLEDLQSTVSGSESPYNGLRNDSSYRTTTRDIEYLSPSNSTTVIRERSKSPNSTTDRVYKTSNYQYSTGPVSYSSNPNTNQLDSLLQDLKNEREITRERDYSHVNDIRLDPGLVEPGSTVTKTTRVYTTSTSGGKPTVQRELVFDPPSASSTLRSSGRAGPKSPSYMKTTETRTVKDVSFEPVLPETETIRTTNTINRYNYSSDTNRERATSPYTTKTVTVDTSVLPDDLRKVPLSDDILPVPGTKVTTTVRTYTYEIPADTPPTQTKTLLYKNEQHNTTNTTYPPNREVPPSVVFKTESYNTVDSTDGYPPGREPSVSPIPPSTTTRVIHKKNTTETTNTLYPGSPGYPSGTGPRPRESSPQPGPNTTIIYKENITNTNVNQYPPNNYGPGSPPHQHPSPVGQPGHPGYPDHPGHPGQPGQPGPTQTYYYKYESSNTKNTLYGPPGSGRPNDQSPTPVITYPNDTLPSRSPRSPHGPGYPNEPGNVTYKYSSTTTSRNTTHGTPSEREPLLQPAPFPLDGLEPQTETDSPPKRLDDLMASFGNGPQPNGRPLVDEPYTPRREVETAVATGKSSAVVATPSKNVAGPPVYYPPGHEMFARKEESGAAYRAGGAWARGQGRYEYESESRSKSKSKSGATMIPVCLPLCCAMPCSIM
ncbi:leucine-rich repeat extensin-like protein 5 [Hermetia illucens]|uniref:leucine-rich repeat extensin-like protein 5 n=1 Tax=Hermetia illucens TaxID=343691 RepID=UPI0018CC4EB6|nr:leucine-rich repeat extensin-like protein 5 [Hermetia illucens]XP_037919263.1 leucine-rich repeat extensin-like protein 5 [Hermetia illucens]XP_037919273.1 leucine-rich repeat extensin-like protein 5 [Hermetia illucens]